MEFTPETVKNLRNIMMCCHITGVYDVNRNHTLAGDDYGIVQEWAESVAALKLRGLLFHNNFSEETCKKYENEYVSFIEIEHNSQFNPNVYRYFIYREFLHAFGAQVENVFVTDVSDVVVLKNPFSDPLFQNNPDALFCGDEPEILDIPWMHDHSAHLRSKITDYAAYENANKQAVLLNCGIVGGSATVMQDFLEKLWDIHAMYNNDNDTAYTGDMGAFNYLARTQFQQRLVHGAPVNTVFKQFEKTNAGLGTCWFRHK
jgi:hypothetical protein